MKFGLVKVLFCSIACISMSASAQWWLIGSDKKSYAEGVDTEIFIKDGKSHYLKSIRSNPGGYGGLVQSITLDKKYRGKRIRLSVSIKTDSVEDWGGAWARINNKGQRKYHPTSTMQKYNSNASSSEGAFDNMGDRPITGTTDWKRYALVLQAGENAQTMSFGIALKGAGKMWFDELEIEVVENNVPLTGLSKQPI